MASCNETAGTSGNVKGSVEHHRLPFSNPFVPRTATSLLSLSTSRGAARALHYWVTVIFSFRWHTNFQLRHDCYCIQLITLFTSLSIIRHSLIDFMNFKIKPTQSFRCTHRTKLYIYVFIKVRVDTYISIYDLL
jgi:hypothetical protein